MKKNRSLKYKAMQLVDCIGSLVFKSRKAALLPVKSVLLLELWGVGDVVLATPALEMIKKAFPDAKITVLAKPYAEDILKNSPYVDEIITCRMPWTKLHGKYNLLKWNYVELFRVFKRLRGEKFSIALDVRTDPRSNLVMYLTGARNRFGYGERGGGFFLTEDLSQPSDKVKSARHRVEQWLDLIHRIAPGVDASLPRLWLGKSELEWARSYLDDIGIKKSDIVLGIHVGASNRFKKWGLANYKAVGSHYKACRNIKVIYFADPDGYGDDITVKGSHLISGVTLRQLISLIACCDNFLCNDGGPMHIATALGVPTLAVFGPTLSHWFGPYGDGHKLIEKDICEYKPCSDYCSFDAPKCLTAITVEEVTDLLDTMIKEKNGNGGLDR